MRIAHMLIFLRERARLDVLVHFIMHVGIPISGIFKLVCYYEQLLNGLLLVPETRSSVLAYLCMTPLAFGLHFCSCLNLVHLITQPVYWTCLYLLILYCFSQLLLTLACLLDLSCLPIWSLAARLLLTSAFLLVLFLSYALVPSCLCILF